MAEKEFDESVQLIKDIPQVNTQREEYFEQLSKYCLGMKCGKIFFDLVQTSFSHVKSIPLRIIENMRYDEKNFIRSINDDDNAKKNLSLLFSSLSLSSIVNIMRNLIKRM